MLCHLDALVPGEGPFHVGWQEGERIGDGGVHAVGGVIMGQVHDDAVLGGAFTQRHHGRGAAQTQDQIAFPVASLELGLG